MSDPIIQTEEITYSYTSKQKRPSLDKVSLTISMISPFTIERDMRPSWAVGSSMMLSTVPCSTSLSLMPATS